jgi:hypothetical protein
VSVVALPVPTGSGNAAILRPASAVGARVTCEDPTLLALSTIDPVQGRREFVGVGKGIPYCCRHPSLQHTCR